MAREILFRGHNGKNFVYGDLVHDKKGVLITNTELDFVVIVNPDSVCQFTGLTDKNGVKVFDLDVLKTGNGLIVFVQWCKEDAAWYCTDKSDVFNNNWSLGHFITDGIEVIGNLFENPELMAGEK